MDILKQVAEWADKLRDLSAAGLKFSDGSYDRERYETIREMVIDMTAVATGIEPAELAPIAGPLLERPSPIAVADAGVFDTEGRILLIKRSDNQRWAMPGGYLDVGESPAQGVVREVLEETGYSCTPKALVGIYDTRFMRLRIAHQLYVIMFICSVQPGDPVPASHEHETLGVEWFTEESLPAEISPGHESRIPDAFKAWKNPPQGNFDPI